MKDPKWMTKIKQAVNTMDNDSLYGYLLEYTAESGDGEMQCGTQEHNRRCFAAEYACSVMTRRLYDCGFLKSLIVPSQS